MRPTFIIICHRKYSQVEASLGSLNDFDDNLSDMGVDYGYPPPHTGLRDGAVTFKLHEYDQIVPHM